MFALILLLLLVGAVFGCWFAPARFVLTLVTLFSVIGFCIFGWRTTFEPGLEHVLTFRAVYKFVALACTAAIIFVLATRKGIFRD